MDTKPKGGLGMMMEMAAPPPKKPAAEGGDYPKLTPPATYAPPDDIQAGGTFEATVKLRVEPDGKLCVLSIDGVPFDEKEAPPEAEEETAEVPERPTLQQARKAHVDQGYQM